MACRTPRLARQRDPVRQALLEATGKALSAIAARVRRGALRGAADIGLAVGAVVNRKKRKPHFELDITATDFHFRRRPASIAAESALDVIDVIRTSLGPDDLGVADCVSSYQRLTQVECAFRCLQLDDLHVRPIRHRLEHRVRAHFFICLFAYLVEWRLRKAWAPLCHTDTEPDARRDPVAPARRSAAAWAKAHPHTLPDGTRVPSFRTLLDHLSTIVRSTHVISPPDTRGKVENRIEVTTRPNARQERALALLNDIAKM